MRALQANFTFLDTCMCSTELLLLKNQKRSTRYPMTLQKQDSITDIFPGSDFWNCAQVKNTKTKNMNKIYPTELRLKEMTCSISLITAETKKTFSAS